MISDFWPFTLAWWKPVQDNRRNLIKAGALILAELERLDRMNESSRVDRKPPESKKTAPESKKDSKGTIRMKKPGGAKLLCRYKGKVVGTWTKNPRKEHATEAATGFPQYVWGTDDD